jgi:hypothetical protein
MVLSTRPTVEHNDLLRISALRHSASPLGIAGLTVPAFWTRDAEAPASSDASASSYSAAKDVRVIAVVVAELKFSKVQWQVFLANVVKRSHHSALQERPKRIDILSVNFATYVLANRVFDGVVFIAKLIQIIVALPFIGRDQIDLIADDLTDEAIECPRVGMFGHLADDIALTANRSDNRSLITTEPALAAFLIPVLVLVLSTEITFINFDNPHELLKIRIEHAGAQSMAHIPSRAIVATSDLALNLECAHTLFAIENLPENFKPSLKRVVGVLEDGSRDYREPIGVTLPAILIGAFPFPRLRDLVDAIRIAATRASNYAVRPATLHQELLAGVVGWEGHHQFLEGHHAMKDKTLTSIRQAPHNRHITG